MSDDSDHGFSLFQQGASTDGDVTSSTGKRKASSSSSGSGAGQPRFVSWGYTFAMLLKLFIQREEEEIQA